MTSMRCPWCDQNVRIVSTSTGLAIEQHSMYLSTHAGCPKSNYHPTKEEMEAIMSLTITKKAVLDAAEECPESKRVLEKLFPDVFATKKNGIIVKPGDRVQDRRETAAYVVTQRVGNSLAPHTPLLVNPKNGNIFSSEGLKPMRNNTFFLPACSGGWIYNWKKVKCTG